MVARVAFSLCALVAGGFLLAGCSKRAAAPPRPTLAMVVGPGGFGDRSFNDEAAAGLAECKRRTGVSFVTSAPAGPSDADAQVVLLATENDDPVIAVGPSFVSDVTRAARRFQNVHFGIVDAIVNEANVESVTFNEQQGAFLAGALAAMVSKTKTVAFLGGVDDARLERSQAGFAAGVAEIDPRVHVLSRYLGSFTDRAGAERLEAALVAHGTDVTFVVDGPAGIGAIDAVKRHRGTFAIGADSNQDGLAPGHVLTSVVKHIDAATLRLCLEAVSQKPTSGHTVLGVADGGIGLTDFAYTRAVIGRAKLARLARIRIALAAGTITPPPTAKALRRFRPVVF